MLGPVPVSILLLLAPGLLAWGSPCPAPPRLEPGLAAVLDDGRLCLALRVPAPSFYLRAGESLHPALKPAFQAEWTGTLRVDEPGAYRFDPGPATLELRGEVIAGPAATVELAAALHPLRLRYRHPGGEGGVRLLWRFEEFPWEPVPASAFLHEPSAELEAQAEAECGRGLVEELGCANCHLTTSPAIQTRRGPDLSDLGARTTAAWIDGWLAQPQAFRPGAAMPVLLAGEERLQVTAYLAGLGLPGARGPAGDAGSPAAHDVAKGKEHYESLGCAACHEQPGLSLEGLGSKSGPRAVAGFLRDPARLDPSGRMPSLLLSEEEARQLAAYLTASRRPASEREPPGLAAAGTRRGRELVQRRGCLACHRLAAPEALENTLAAPPLEALAPERGCLELPPPQGLPRYDLDPAARRALASFLRFFREHPDTYPAPIHAFERRARQLRCTACHDLDGDGPRVPLAERIPPLGGAGSKLKTGWIEKVLLERVRIRPHLRLRMPHYPAPAVTDLIEPLALREGLAPREDPGAPREGAGDPDTGVEILGSDDARGGLSCITCHDLGDHRPVADEKGPQLLTVAERLRYRWFERWIFEPSRIVPGTAMPAFFGERPPLEARRAASDLWAALALGEAMPEPAGVRAGPFFSGDEALPVPGNEAVVQRVLLPGATPAAIAVGLPRRAKQPGISFCFDAGRCQLLYAWQGGFLDLAPSFQKAMKDPRILGETFYRVAEFPLRPGDPERVPERRFRGYRIAGGFPEFHYTLSGAEVRERFVPLDSGRGFVQEFLLSRLEEPLWCVLPGGEGVEVRSTAGSFRDGRLRVPAGSGVRFDVVVERAGEPAAPGGGR